MTPFNHCRNKTEALEAVARCRSADLEPSTDQGLVTHDLLLHIVLLSVTQYVNSIRLFPFRSAKEYFGLEIESVSVAESSARLDTNTLIEDPGRSSCVCRTS